MIEKKLKIAITGGIGSGKTTVSKIVRSLGFDVYSADVIYNELLDDDKVVEKIYDLLELKKVVVDGRVYFDRQAVSSAVFSDREKLRKLNTFSHALVYERLKEIFNEYPYEKPVFFEIPLLFEEKKEDEFDKVFIIYRDVNDRIKAVKKRSGLNEKDIVARIKNQIDYDIFDFKKHTLIINDCSFEELEERVKLAIESIG